MKSQLEKKMQEFLATATPKQYAQFIEMMEQSEHDFSDLTPMLKVAAFLVMKDVLNISTFVFTNPNSKSYRTELYLDENFNKYTLSISKKDSQDKDAAYVRLYDQHKDELLQMIEVRSAAVPEKEAVTKQTVKLEQAAEVFLYE